MLHGCPSGFSAFCFCSWNYDDSQNCVTLGEHSHTGNDIAGEVGIDGRERVLLEHAPDDANLTLGLSVGLVVDPFLALLEWKVGLE